MKSAAHIIPTVPIEHEIHTDSDTQLFSTDIAWIVSSCVSKSRREDYAAEFRKHAKLDVYGLCGELNCSKECEAENDIARVRFNFSLVIYSYLMQVSVSHMLIFNRKSEV